MYGDEPLTLGQKEVLARAIEELVWEVNQWCALNHSTVVPLTPARVLEANQLEGLGITLAQAVTDMEWGIHGREAMLICLAREMGHPEGDFTKLDAPPCGYVEKTSRHYGHVSLFVRANHDGDPEYILAHHTFAQQTATA